MIEIMFGTMITVFAAAVAFFVKKEIEFAKQEKELKKVLGSAF